VINKFLGLEVGVLIPYREHVVFAREDGQLFYVPIHLIPEGDAAPPWDLARAGQVRVLARAKLLEVVKGKHADFLTWEDWQQSGLTDLVPSKLRRFLTGVVKTQGFTILVEPISDTPEETNEPRDRPVEPIYDSQSSAGAYDDLPLLDSAPEFTDWVSRAQHQVQTEGHPIGEEPEPIEVETVDADSTKANSEFGFDEFGQTEPRRYQATPEERRTTIEVGPNRTKTVGEVLWGRRDPNRDDPASETPLQSFLEEMDREAAQVGRVVRDRMVERVVDRAVPTQLQREVNQLRASIERLTDAQEYDGVLIRALLSRQNQSVQWQYAKWLSVVMLACVALWTFGTPLWGWGVQAVDQVNRWNEQLEQLDNHIPFLDWPKDQGE
jgi:hypothetical protein